VSSRYPVLMVLATVTAGCASVVSVPNPNDAEGLTYYLPKKDFLVSLKVTATDRTLSVETTPAYPDDKHRYVIHFGRNLAGKNELDIGVTPSGLLTSAKSTTTSSFSDVLKGLGGLAAAMSVTRAAAAPGPCTAQGTYSIIVGPGATKVTFCRDFTITVASLSTQAFNAAAAPADAQRAGVYYRNALPYTVSVDDTTSTAGPRTFVLFSPSEAKPQYLPIERTLFANNEATLTFEDGMPKGYKQSADGELVGLAKLPASVVAAYFDAIGNAFDQRKGALTNETEYLKAVQAAELQRLQLEQCKAAVASGDQAAIKAACAD
jgi:hypothetical protein